MVTRVLARGSWTRVGRATSIVVTPIECRRHAEERPEGERREGRPGKARDAEGLGGRAGGGGDSLGCRPGQGRRLARTSAEDRAGAARTGSGPLVPGPLREDGVGPRFLERVVGG